ncbi:hypothetical protein [Sphingopyxis sp.]|uniref:hypothetical protein n=1 Tax=Sphingopyxis sp. TaxID=1908224 RepID=UPI002D76FAD4|nr:hypothetical protein [Sphingopyxis sp.]HET6526845.1 hypothetical protein [Sphingopyxis sp.]
MIWGYIFIALIAAATAYILYAGDREARLAILTLVGGSVLTIVAVYNSGQYYESANALVGLVDFAILGVFLWLSLASRRYWTLCLPALQAIVCITHVAKLIAPDIIPRAYVAAQGHWSYYQILLIVTAAHMHSVRRKLLREWIRSRTPSGDRTRNV